MSSKHSNTSLATDAGARAFSLVELLVVLAITAIIAALAIPQISGTMQAYQLTSTGQTAINYVVLARQSALSGSHAVQVRFYYLPEIDASSPSSAPLAVYRGMQCFTENNPSTSGGTVTALTKPFFFAPPVIISNSATVSPLTTTTLQTPLATDPLLPGYQLNYKYLVFRFRPDGSTDLQPGSNSITLVLENQPVAANGLPKNFQTLQIDPTMGSVRGFRP